MFIPVRSWLRVFSCISRNSMCARTHQVHKNNPESSSLLHWHFTNFTASSKIGLTKPIKTSSNKTEWISSLLCWSLTVDKMTLITDYMGTRFQTLWKWVTCEYDVKCHSVRGVARKDNSELSHKCGKHGQTGLVRHRSKVPSIFFLGPDEELLIHYFHHSCLPFATLKRHCSLFHWWVWECWSFLRKKCRLQNTVTKVHYILHIVTVLQSQANLWRVSPGISRGHISSTKGPALVIDEAKLEPYGSSFLQHFWDLRGIP